MSRKVFATRSFRRLYLGLTASMFGDSLMLLVLSMWVKSLTGSNGAAGLTFLWLTAPALLAPVFGYVVDRVPRRTFLILGNLLSALAVLPLLLVRDAGDVWIVYAVAFCYGISFVVMPAALNGLLKDLLPESQLVEANASLSVTREALRLVGPLAGASLFALSGGGAVALVDAGTFLVAAAAVAALSVDETVKPRSADSRWRAEVTAGAAHIRRSPLLLHSTVAVGLCLLVLGFSESAIYAVVDAFHKPVTFVGPVVTVQGVGAIAGGLLSSRLIRRTGEPRAIAIGLGLLAGGLGGVSVATEVWQVLAATVVFGSGIPLLIVAYNTVLQRQTPGRLMGRVSTTAEVLTTTPQAVSIATGALLVTLIDYRLIFALMAVGTALAATYLLRVLRGRMGPVPCVEIAEPSGTPHREAVGQPLSPASSER